VFRFGNDTVENPEQNDDRARADAMDSERREGGRLVGRGFVSVAVLDQVSWLYFLFTGGFSNAAAVSSKLLRFHSVAFGRAARIAFAIFARVGASRSNT